MKKRLIRRTLSGLLLSGLILAGTGTVRAQSAAVQAPIDRVIVYPDRAEVLRRAGDVALQRGDNRLLFKGLSARLMEDSLRVDVKGAAVMLNISVERVFPPESAYVRVRELEAELRRLEFEDQGLQHQEQGVQARRRFLEALQAGTADKIAVEFLAKLPSLPEVKALMDFVYEEDLAAAEELRKIGRLRVDLQHRIEAVKSELEQINARLPKEARDVTVTLRSAQSASAQVDLSYLVAGASWRPRYQARVLDETDKLELSLLADVRQNTGEDWKDSQLVFSTAMPARSAQAPELPPWYLDFKPPVTPLRGKALTAMAPEASLERTESEGTADLTQAAIQLGETTTHFTVQERMDVPGDGSGHGVVLDRLQLANTLSYLSVPKLTPAAYLQAAVKNEAAYPLLRGPVDLFIGSQYVGRSRLDIVPPQQAFEIDLGVDESIKVERNLLRRFEAEKGLLSKERRISYLYEIKVENFKSRPIGIKVLDQVPVSRNADIKVTVSKLDPEPEAEDVTGLITWEADLAPRRQQTFTIGYDIQFPRDKELAGSD